MITSSLPMSSLIVNAGTDGTPGSTGSYGIGDENWMYNYDDAIVMRIAASSITDSTDVDSMACEKVRYGNGDSNMKNKNAAMHYYPILIRAEDGSYSNVPFQNSGNWSSYSSVRADMTSATVRTAVSSGITWREGHCREFFNMTNYTYMPATQVRGLDMSANGCSSKSVYLEDAIKRVLTLKDKGKIREQDVIDFWYFYTRIAAIASNSDTGSGSNPYTTGMSNYINSVFINDTNAVLKSNTSKQMVQSGYMVALYAIYGDSAIRAFTGDDFKVRTGSEYTNRLWCNGYKSFVFEKCWTGLSNNNPWVYNNVFISMHSYAEICVFANDSCDFNPYLEYKADINRTGSNDTSSIFWTRIGHGDYGDTLWKNLLPAYTYDQKNERNEIVAHSGDRRGDGIYYGWGYVEISTGGPPPLNKTFPDVEQAQLSVTYNGYLSGSDDTNYTNESDKFGDNGHVMSDLIYLSEPMSKDDLKAYNGFDTYVTKSIKLSTPFEDSTYNLKKLGFRIVNAFGSINEEQPDGSYKAMVFNNGDGTGDISSGHMKVNYDDIKYQWSKDKARYYKRIKFEITSAGFASGTYTDETGEHNYKIFEYSGSGNLVETSKTLSGIKTCTWNDIKNDNDPKCNKCSYLLMPRTTDAYPIIKDSDGKYYLCPTPYVSNLLIQVRADYACTYTRDDVLNYKEDGTTKKKSAIIDEYLLTKNYKTSDMIGDKSKLYSMIDNYATNVWGDVYTKNNTYSDNTQTGVSMFKTKEDGVWKDVSEYNYSIGTLFDSYCHIYPGNDYFRLATENYIRESDSPVIKSYRLNSTGIVTSGVSKLKFKMSVSKTAPLIANRDNNSSMTILKSDLNTLVRSYGNNLVANNSSINVNGIYYTDFNRKSDGRMNKSMVMSQQFYAKVSPFNKIVVPSPTIREGNSSIPNVSELFTHIGTSNNVGDNRYYYDYANDLLDRFSAERQVAKNLYDGKLDLRVMTLNTSGSYIVNSYKDRAYVQAEFPKLLASYEKYLYGIRGNIDSTLTPYTTSWINSGSLSFDDIKTLYNVDKGVINADTYVGASTSSKDVDNGFIRFAKTESKVLRNGTTSTTSAYTLRMNSRNRPLTISNYKASSNVDSDIINDNTINASNEYRLIAPWTQNSYDIPIRYNIKSHTTVDKNKQAIATTFSKSGSEISMSYQYSSDLTSGIHKYGSTGGTASNDWKYSKVSLGVFPEVTMWAENDKTSNPTATTTYTEVKTVGAKQRYIPAMTYSTVKFNDLKVKANVLGTAVAYDTRAKKLASSLGTADTQVLYSGSALTGSVESTAGGTVQTYVFHFQGGGTLNEVDFKTAWDNQNYNPTNVASKAMSVLLNKFKVESNVNMGIYNGRNYNDFDIKLNGASGSSLTAGTPVQDEVYYQVYIKGGRVDNVVSRMKVQKANGNTDYISLVKYNFKNYNGTANSVGVATNYRNINTSWTTQYNALSQTYKAKVTSYLNKAASDSRTDTIAVLKNMKLIGTNNLTSGTVISGAFEYGSGVDLPSGLKNSTGGTKSYNEDCSVLQVLSYTANISSSAETGTFTEQLPINLGPETPKNKNDYFSNGYKGFINASVAIKTKEALGSTAANTTIANASVTHNIKGETGTVSIPITGGSSTASAKLDAAKKAVPDFIIGDVPISEALSG